MSKKKRKECCYAGIFNKIDHIENKINEIKTQLTNLKDNFIDHNGDEVHLNEPAAPKEMPDV
jgi:regulator of replication initiation timing